MGRVSKYRKIKAHDPFYRGPRRDRQGVVDLCPENEDDQPVPKTLLRLMRRAEDIEKKNKTKKSESAGTKTDSGSNQPASSGDCVTNRRGKRKVEAEGEVREGPMFSKRKGESLRSYLERVDMEANAKIMETFRKNRKPSDRRKRRLEERWRKAVARRRGVSREGDLESDSLRDQVKFGEVVQAPPQLKSKPRGSKPTTASKPLLLLHQKMTASHKPTHTPPVVGLKRQKDLETERERVISVYRQIKKAALIRNSS